MTTIAVLVGSLRADSINRTYAEHLQALAPEGVNFQLLDLNLPLFNQDLEADFPAAATALKQAIEAADGVLFVTPEYNRSFPGVLKNAIDWASRPSGSNSFSGKPAAIAGVSGSLATTQAQHQLKSILVYLNMHLLGQPEMYINAKVAYTEAGDLTEDAKAYAQNFLNTFIEHIKRFSA